MSKGVWESSQCLSAIAYIDRIAIAAYWYKYGFRWDRATLDYKVLGIGPFQAVDLPLIEVDIQINRGPTEEMLVRT
jgi:hypothetical protein